MKHLLFELLWCQNEKDSLVWLGKNYEPTHTHMANGSFKVSKLNGNERRRKLEEKRSCINQQADNAGGGSKQKMLAHTKLCK